MKQIGYVLRLTVLLLVIGYAFTVDQQARGETVPLPTLICYQWDIFPEERYRLDIRVHSPLSGGPKEDKFDNPRQFVFSVFGKHVGTCGGDTVRPAMGTLISTVPVGRPLEARLGLQSLNITGEPIFCRNVEISCKAGEAPGFPPPVWNCFGQNNFGLEFPLQLTRVDPLQDPRCGLFEDGTPDPEAKSAASSTASSTTSSVGSGLAQQ
jgi:hypothetical protein